MKAFVYTFLAITLCQWAFSHPSHDDDHSGAHYNEKVQVENVLQSSKSWDGGMLPEYPAGQPETQVLKITIPGRMRLPLHYHPVINTAVMIQGHLRVTTENGVSKEFKAGDVLNEAVNTRHFGENIGDEPVVLYVFYVNVEGGEPITVRGD